MRKCPWRALLADTPFDTRFEWFRHGSDKLFHLDEQIHLRVEPML
jgi:hypothetical protein